MFKNFRCGLITIKKDDKTPIAFKSRDLSKYLIIHYWKNTCTEF